MKKMNTTKLMAVLVALCLITSTFVGSTLAKYVTDGTANDTARVAKWGVTVTSVNAADSTMFKKEYAKDDNTFTLAANTVVSTTDDVIAPGTKGDLADVVVAGTPEVAVRVTYEPTLTLTGWEVDSNEYCPLVIKVEETEYKIDGVNINNIAELKQAVEDAIKACKNDYVANEAIAYGTDAPTVSWSWPFSTSAENDVKDTALGNEAASGTAATIELTIRTVATQID